MTLDPAKNPVAEYLRGTFDWHLDGATDDIPIMATVLSAHAVAASGGETEFASTYAAYDALSDDGAAGAPDRSASCTPSRPRSGWSNPDPSPEELAIVAEAAGRRPTRLVWRHRSGRRSLVLGATASHVEGMADDDGRALLARPARPLHRARARLPPRVGGRRPRHLGQPRRVAPGVPVRRVVGARHAPHDDRRRRADPMTDANGPRIAPLPPDEWSDEVMQAIAPLRPPDAKHQLPRRKGGPKGLNVLGHPGQPPGPDARVPHLQRAHPLHLDARRPAIGSCSSCGWPRSGTPTTSGSSTSSSRAARASPTRRSSASAAGADATGVVGARRGDAARGRRAGRGRDGQRRHVGELAETFDTPPADGPRLHRRRLRPAWPWRSGRSASSSTPTSRLRRHEHQRGTGGPARPRP